MLWCQCLQNLNLSDTSFVPLLLQLRREFRAVAGIDGRATSLMSSWPTWVLQIVELSKVEATTRRGIRLLVESFKVDVEVHNPTGLYTT